MEAQIASFIIYTMFIFIVLCLITYEEGDGPVDRVKYIAISFLVAIGTMSLISFIAHGLKFIVEGM